MALSDVRNGLVALCTQILYPNGSANPSILSYNGNPLSFRIYAGWPVSENLDQDLENGIVNISIWQSNDVRNISTLDESWDIISQPVATLTATVSGQAVTIGGTVTAGESVGISISGTTYAYLVQSGDTLSIIASALAALIPGATAAGDVVTVSSVGNLVARIGVPTLVGKDVARQKQTFWVVCWANSPIARDLVVETLQAVLSDTFRIPLSDGSTANLEFVNDKPDDMLQKESLWRRDLYYSAIYSTVKTETVMTVVGTNTALSLQPAP